MNRRKCIKHSDNIFAPEKKGGISAEIAMCAPLAGFLLGCYIAIFFGVI